MKKAVVPVKDPHPLIPYASSLVPDQVKRVSLPAGVVFSYGCRGCEWKGTSMCKAGFPWGSSNTLKEGVCPERAVYLKGFYRGEHDTPNFTQWESDYNQGVAQKQLQQMLEQGENLRKQALVIESAIAQMEADGTAPDDDNLKKHRAQHNATMKQHTRIQENWFQLWKSIRNLQETRLTREAPKKVEVTHRDAVSISDFQNMIKRADVVDADYEKIKEDDE